ncbi:MAG: hypothetical protein U1A73_25675 [Pseudomonas sp.]|nr:hypothetical protein [Pseudomonas sp.]MDZ4350463.1 hypothetical protein [Xanthomonadaceae bacterium]
MKCFVHNDKDALGVCKHCQKGICADCLTLVGGSMSCKGDCEVEVAAGNYMMERGKKVYRNLGNQWGPSVFLNGIGGAFFVGFGIYNYGRPSTWLLIGLGSTMLVAAFMSAVQGRRIGDKSAALK